MMPHLLVPALLHLPHGLVPLVDPVARSRAAPRPTPLPPGSAPLGDALDKIAQIADFISSHFLVIGVSLCTLVFGWGGLLWIVSGSSPQHH